MFMSTLIYLLLAMRFNANFQKSDDSRIIVQEFLKNSHQNCGQKSRLRPLLPLIFSTFHFLYTNFQTARRGMYLLLDTVYVIQKAEWYNLVYRLDGQLWYHNSRTIMKTIGGPSWRTYRGTLRKRDTVEAQLRSPTAIIIYSTSTESAD